MGKKTPIDMSVTEKDVLEVQAKWAAAIKTISAAFLKHKDFKMEDYQKVAADAAGELYLTAKAQIFFSNRPRPVSISFGRRLREQCHTSSAARRSKEDTLRTVASQ